MFEANGEAPIVLPGVQFDDLLEIFNLIYYGKTGDIEEERVKSVKETAKLFKVSLGNEIESPRYFLCGCY